MLLNQIEAFVEVARRKRVHRAANALSVRQPSLSRRIHALEVALGSDLFRRTRDGMELTAAGRAFLPHAERALESVQAGVALVRELEGSESRRTHRRALTSARSAKDPAGVMDPG